MFEKSLPSSQSWSRGGLCSLTWTLHRVVSDSWSNDDATSCRTDGVFYEVFSDSWSLGLDCSFSGIRKHEILT